MTRDQKLSNLLFSEADLICRRLDTTSSIERDSVGWWRVTFDDLGNGTPLRILIGQGYPLKPPLAVMIPTPGSTGDWYPLYPAHMGWEPGDDLRKIVAYARAASFCHTYP